ncbi:MAG TPA: glycosyltransferase [Solirubrobacteraceae bacterium]|jgi:GT2 family glycosyltransferase|nr:glycosyltransferase [Solirubrobacteraceae bacterium]
MTGESASVVIACHTEDRFDSLRGAIGSAKAQDPLEVIVAVDHNPALCERLRAAEEDVAIVEHDGTPGASGARNAGALLARGPLLVFLDDDVRTRPGWLRELTAPFADDNVVGTGGMTAPAWQGPRPAWFPDEFGWVIGASYAGLPDDSGPVRNVWSENMAVRREVFEQVGGFRDGFGKVGHTSRPEDTDLCIRISASAPDTHWMYVPAAVVDHEVPHERSTFAFFLKRCYWEGAGKVELSAHLGEDRDLGAERSYLLRTLPLAVLRDLRRRRFSRALAIVAGTAAAAAGAASTVLRAAAQRTVRR